MCRMSQLIHAPASKLDDPMTNHVSDHQKDTYKTPYCVGIKAGEGWLHGLQANRVMKAFRKELVV